MKNILLVLFAITFVSCGSFEPGNIEYYSAISSPKSIETDSVFVLFKTYTREEAELVYDVDFKSLDFEPIYVSIFNNSRNKIHVNMNNIDNLFDIEKVHEETKTKPFGYFLLWSTPWSISLLAGLPVYYGIAWPVFGFIAMAKTNTANDKRESFYNSKLLENITLKKGQEISGIVFISKKVYNKIRIVLLKDDESELEFQSRIKSHMF